MLLLVLRAGVSSNCYSESVVVVVVAVGVADDVVNVTVLPWYMNRVGIHGKNVVALSANTGVCSPFYGMIL